MPQYNFVDPFNSSPQTTPAPSTSSKYNFVDPFAVKPSAPLPTVSGADLFAATQSPATAPVASTPNFDLSKVDFSSPGQSTAPSLFNAPYKGPAPEPTIQFPVNVNNPAIQNQISNEQNFEASDLGKQAEQKRLSDIFTSQLLPVPDWLKSAAGSPTSIAASDVSGRLKPNDQNESIAQGAGATVAAFLPFIGGEAVVNKLLAKSPEFLKFATEYPSYGKIATSALGWVGGGAATDLLKGSNPLPNVPGNLAKGASFGVSAATSPFIGLPTVFGTTYGVSKLEGASTKGALLDAAINTIFAGASKYMAKGDIATTQKIAEDNAYKVLGLDSSATPEEVKQAYRKLSFENHPDRGGDASAQAKINLAYELLSDKQDGIVTKSGIVADTMRMYENVKNTGKAESPVENVLNLAPAQEMGLADQFRTENPAAQPFQATDQPSLVDQFKADNPEANSVAEVPKLAEQIKATDNQRYMQFYDNPKQTFADWKPAPDGTVANEVIQVKSPDGAVDFYRIPFNEKEKINALVDLSIAGKPTPSGTWHITAKSPEDMLQTGAKDQGVINSKDIPSSFKQVQSEKQNQIVSPTTYKITFPTPEGMEANPAKESEMIAKDYVLQEIQNAESGKRIFTDNGVIASKSSFPDWVPSELRSTPVFKAVINHITNDTVPTSSRQKALYDIVSERMNIAAKNAQEIYQSTTKDGQFIPELVDKEIEHANQLISDLKSNENFHPENIAFENLPSPQSKATNASANKNNVAEASNNGKATSSLSESRTEGNNKSIAAESQRAISPTEQSGGSGAVTLQSTIIPGLNEFIEQDIIPKSKGAVSNAKEAYREIVTLVSPTSAVDPKHLDVIMKAKGGFEKAAFRTEQTMKQVKKMWDKIPEDQRLQFLADIEAGNKVAPELQEFADMYRQRMDNLYKAITEYKDVNFIDNYMPHFWEKPNKVKPFLESRRPLEGSKSFLKQRVFSDIRAGMDAGFKLVDTNPEVLVQMAEQNVGKFVAAQEMKAGLKELNNWHMIPNGGKLPDGYDFINDPIARIYFPPTEIHGKKVFIEAGRIAVPSPVATIINNHLSENKITDSVWGRGLLTLKNNLNAVQLSMSAFHVVLEGGAAIANGLDVAIGQALRGDLLASLESLVKAPINPIRYTIDGQKFYNGDKELMKIEDDIFTGGTTLRNKQYYNEGVLKTFIDNVKNGNYIGATLRSPFAAIEASMKPMFEYWIPRMKIGAFRDLFAFELEHQSALIQSGVKTRAQVAREVYNNIENRFGLINYDNLFWNQSFKAANMLAFRAVGFNYGTIREFGGAVTNVGAQFNDAIHGKIPYITSKQRNAVGYTFMIAVVGAIYMYLHTGEWPQELKDYFAPKTGLKNANGDDVRSIIPSYAKDVYGAKTDPLKTVTNKLAPELSLIADLLTNKDYYGNLVRNPKDPVGKQLIQIGNYLGNTIKPFSLRNITELTKNKATNEQKMESFFGINKAPAGIIDSENTQKIKDNMRTMGPKTPEEQDLQNTKNSLRDRIQSGETVTRQEIIDSGAAKDHRGATQFIKNAKKTSLQRAYQTIPKSVRKEQGITKPSK